MCDKITYVPTIGGRYQRHLPNLVSNLFRIREPIPSSKKLKKGDLVLCLAHSGDCFQDYVVVKSPKPGCYKATNRKFGSYGVGNAELVAKLTPIQFERLKAGEEIEYIDT